MRKNPNFSHSILHPKIMENAKHHLFAPRTVVGCICQDLLSPFATVSSAFSCTPEFAYSLRMEVAQQVVLAVKIFLNMYFQIFK